MDELKLETLNEIIKEISGLNCSEFSNLHDALREFKDDLDKDELMDIISENYTMESEDDLKDLTEYERENFLTHIKNMY